MNKILAHSRFLKGADREWLQERVKAKKAGKAVFKIPAPYTSQECADCSHTHPNNRKTQAHFHCESCGHSDNADNNASLVIKKRAIHLLLDSGTALHGTGIPVLRKGRGAVRQTKTEKSVVAVGCEASKKKRVNSSCSGLPLEARRL